MERRILSHSPWGFTHGYFKASLRDGEAADLGFTPKALFAARKADLLLGISGPAFFTGVC